MPETVEKASRRRRADPSHLLYIAGQETDRRFPRRCGVLLCSKACSLPSWCCNQLMSPTSYYRTEGRTQKRRQPVEKVLAELDKRGGGEVQYRWRSNEQDGFKRRGVCPIGRGVSGGAGSPGPVLPPSAARSGSLVRP